MTDLQRRLDELETAFIRISNEHVAAKNDTQNLKHDVTKLRQRYHSAIREIVRLNRELAEIGTRVDAVENRPRERPWWRFW